MATSQLEAILAATVALLAGVTGVLNVHDYEPVATAPGQIPGTLEATGAIHFWSVTPETTRRDRRMNQEAELYHTLVMRGYLDVGDTRVTTPVVRALILDIDLAFDGVFEVAGSAEIYGPLQITWPTVRKLADTFLIHYVELRVQAQELVSP